MLKSCEKKFESIDKNEAKAAIKQMHELLAAQQQKLSASKQPVFILIEGWAAAGKGSLIGEMIKELDPRFYHAQTSACIPEKDMRYPFLHQYACAMPENGKIVFLDSGWMDETVKKYLAREITEKQYKKRIRMINEFERQLKNDGYLLLKFFVQVDKKTQFKRLKALKSESSTEWRATFGDVLQNRDYDLFYDEYDYFMERTNDIPWHIVDGTKKTTCVYSVMKTITEEIGAALEAGKYNGDPYEAEFPLVDMPKLKDVDLSVTISDEDYKKELKALQKRLGELHNIVYRKKIPVVICYEGWDAAGKGGNIRRLTYRMDPRGYDVMPIASPSPAEKNRHHLWRFWTRLPKTGHINIFDRTWYGRCMVERLEGFCTENDWKRSFAEINEFERSLTEWGAVVIKFWIHIDSDTQLERFTARQNTPEKQWKITEEDWRNREKWDQYEVAVNEMIEKTSTKYAPWYIIESNDKKYARIRTLRVVIDALEKAIEERI